MNEAGSWLRLCVKAEIKFQGNHEGGYYQTNVAPLPAFDKNGKV